jgi:hypothetical protein
MEKSIRLKTERTYITSNDVSIRSNDQKVDKHSFLKIPIHVFALHYNFLLKKSSRLVMYFIRRLYTEGDFAIFCNFEVLSIFSSVQNFTKNCIRWNFIYE